MDNKALNISYMVAVYLRLSKEDEDLSSKGSKMESNSIANQKTLILNVLKSMPNITLYDIYIDDGFTGLDFERPDFRRMRDDIYDGKANMVIVKDLSRLGRDYIEAGRYVRKIFPALKVRFVSVLDRFDSLTATPSDINLLIPIKTFVNDNYSRDISGKVKSTQEVMRNNGLYVGSYVAYGYKKLADNKNVIVPDEYAADIVKRMYKMKLDGLSAGAIANKLNEIGILAPGEYKKTLGINFKSGWQTKTQIKWSSMAVSRILSNKIYIGVLEQGKRRKVSYKVNKIINKPQNEWVIKENNHMPIIAATDFENVQRMLRVDLRIAPDEVTVYIYAGMLYCGDCGRTMVRRVIKYDTGEKVYFICTTYNRGNGCSRHRIDETKLSELLLDALNAHIATLAQMNQLLSEIDKLKIDYSDILANDDELNARYEELNRCKKKELALHRDVADSVISMEEYKQFQQIYKEKCTDLENSIEKIKSEIAGVFETGLVTNYWMEEFKQYRNLTKISRAVLVSLIDKIIVYEDKRLEIIFKYRDEYRILCKLIEDVSVKISREEEIHTHG